MAAERCSVCAEVAGRIATPGGPIFENEWWNVAHHAGPWTDPGELIVKVRRHCESLSELTPAEAASLGPVLRAAVAAVERAVQPERVYVACWGERVRHVHFFLLPRTRTSPPGTSRRISIEKAGASSACGASPPIRLQRPGPTRPPASGMTRRGKR